MKNIKKKISKKISKKPKGRPLKGLEKRDKKISAWLGQACYSKFIETKDELNLSNGELIENLMNKKGSK